MRGKGLSEQALKQKLIRSGSDYEGLLSRHTRHECNVQRILKAVTRRKMIVQLRDRESMTSQDVTSCDIIIAAGGDGNFLTGASHVADPDKLIVGINTDPERSQGYLCISPDAEQSIEDIVDAILERRLKLMHRQRLRVCIGGRDLPLLALNEAFIGESDPTQLTATTSFYSLLSVTHVSLSLSIPFLSLFSLSRVSYFQLSCRDQLISDKIRSSGLLVYTGSGSTSWAYNINKISTDTVKNILGAVHNVCCIDFNNY
jgi:NAD+ kinase